jgi:chaperonin GroEL
MTYNPKDLKFDDDARERLISGVEKLAKTVKSTLGPKGNTVLIESPNHTKGMTVTKDGATVAKSVELLDPIENLSCMMLKDASINTAANAGDGSTSSIVIAEALVKAGFETFKTNSKLNKAQTIKHITAYTEQCLEYLSSVSKQVDDDMIFDIAHISANNDKDIGQLVSDAYKKAGREGLVHFEKSTSFDTYTEIINGAKINRGYVAREFINDFSTDTFFAEDCYVLVCEQEISNFIHQLKMPLIEELAKHNVVFIASFSNNAKSVVIANKLRQGFRWCIVEPPAMGYRRKELMSDLAASIGATYISDESGNDISLITMKDFAKVKRIIVSDDMTVITPDQSSVNLEAKKERENQIRQALAEAKKESEKKFLQERLSLFLESIAVIYVGGMDMEQKELYDRVEDAVYAVKSALEEGILPGGGKALVEAMKFLSEKVQPETDEQKAALYILSIALLSPMKQILANAELSGEEEAYITSAGFNQGVNAKSGEKCDLIKEGIIDPTKVVKTALVNASRVAATILTTNAVVTLAREN